MSPWMPGRGIGTDAMNAFFASLSPMLPELVLVGGAMALLMLGVFRKESEDNAEQIGWLAILLLVVAGAIMCLRPLETTALFNGSFVVDAFASLHEGPRARGRGRRAPALVRRHARR